MVAQSVERRWIGPWLMQKFGNCRLHLFLFRLLIKTTFHVGTNKMFISATGSVLVVLWQETKVHFLIWHRNNSKRLIFSTHICTFISSMFEKNFIKFNSIFSARNQNFGKTNNFAFDTFESGFSKDLIWTRTGLTGMKKGCQLCHEMT